MTLPATTERQLGLLSERDSALEHKQTKNLTDYDGLHGAHPIEGFTHTGICLPGHRCARQEHLNPTMLHMDKI